MNLINRKATKEDRVFIKTILKNQLSEYRDLYQKKKNRFVSKYEILKPEDWIDKSEEEIEIQNVYIVCFENEKNGAYYIKPQHNVSPFENYCLLSWLAVAQDYKRKGVCSYILKTVQDYAQKNDFRGVILGVNLTNSPAIYCYKKSGFDFIEGTKEDCSQYMIRQNVG